MAKRGKLTGKEARSEISRPIRWRKYKHFMLIICEDQKTEPAYFERFTLLFPPETVFIRTVGTGRKTKGIVEQAIRERNLLHEEAKKEADEVWLVFDKDDEGNNPTTLQNFEEAWGNAIAENLNLAFSNEVFELWLLLHVADVAPDHPIGRQEVYLRLQETIRQYLSYDKFEYVHGNLTILDIIEAIGNETEAIRRAQLLENFHQKAGNKPLQANPGTMVYRLIIQLRDLIAWYNE
ncbi:RloB family protein [Rhodoflexus sp.]